MIRAALLVCALAASARAHIYERCELARELTSLGVQRDHLATWVCIAYHESRFDTSARNHGSGDHGLFQISELYWCGSGKACGVPCTAFRDEDISNDLACALKIHKEHTRLQGDGFLAWVVYPQHCKHINAKKYLVDCEASLKNVTINTDPRSRSLKNDDAYTTPKPFDANYYAKHLPSFLAINSIFEGNQAKQSEGEGQKTDWLNFKIDNIDNIKLPMLNKDELIKYVTLPPSTTTTTVKYSEDNYSTKSSKIDWINYKIDNIDSIELPTSAGNNKNNLNNGLPNWFNIKIDSKINALTLPMLSNDNADRNAPSATPSSFINYEENYLGQNYKNDWVNYKIDNIDDLKLPSPNKNIVNQRNNNLPNWLNIKIDIKIDDLMLPVISNGAVKKYEPPSSTPTTSINYEENYLGQNYNHDWVNFRLDNIDDLELPSFSKTIGNQRNNGLPSWLNVKIDSKIDKIDSPTFEKLVNVETATRAASTTSRTVRTTTIDPELIGIKPPMPRRIESNQFRRKMKLMETIMTEIAMVMKNMSAKVDTLSTINTSPQVTTTNVQSQPTTTYKPVTTDVTTRSPSTTTWYTSSPSTTKSVYNFQWKSTSRPITPVKDITTLKSVSSQDKIGPTNDISKQSNADSATKTNIDSILITQAPYIVNKQIVNDKSTTTIPTSTKYSQELSPTTSARPTSLAIPTTKAPPTTTSRYEYNYSFPVLTTTTKPEIATAPSTRNVTRDWNKRLQDFKKQFTFKPFSWSTQKPTSRLDLLSNLPTWKPFTTNTSVLKSQNRINGSKPTLSPIVSTTAKPYWSWATYQTGLSNRTNTRLNSTYKPFSTLAPNKTTQLVQGNSFAQSAAPTVSPPGRRRWSFSFGTNTNKSLERQINKLQSVRPLAVSSTIRPFWINKTDVNNVSSESRRYSTFISPSTKTPLELSSTVKSISTTVKSLAYSNAKPQIVTAKPTENLPNQIATKSTPSIFDLYLHPEKYHSVPQFQIPSRTFSANKLTIFSGGTTPAASNVTLIKP